MLPPRNANRRTLFFCLFFLLAGTAGAAPPPPFPVFIPSCNAQGKIKDGPQGSAGELCGTVAGGPCANLDASYYPNLWLLKAEPNVPAFHPNGDSAWNSRCDVDLESGKQMVCDAVLYPGKKVGTCKICGDPGPKGNPALYTYLGCPPKGVSCPKGLVLRPDGKCWGSNLPSWECEADCTQLYDKAGWCSNGSAWWTWFKGVYPDTPQNQYSKPICASLSCPLSGLSCAAVGQACKNNKCVTK
jgi:hypothetical protein